MFLTSQQVASFFSRLAAKGRLPDVTTGSDKEAGDAKTESALQELSNAVMREVSFKRPIICDCYNICDLISPCKLSSFSIQMVKEFCNFLEIHTSHEKVTRKQPYLDLLLLVRTVPVTGYTVTELGLCAMPPNLIHLWLAPPQLDKDIRTANLTLTLTTSTGGPVR